MRHIKLFESFKTNLDPGQVWYHGRDVKLDSFHKSFEYITREGNNEHGPGIYLTSQQKDAKGYGNFIHQVKFTGNAIQRGDKATYDDAKLATRMIKKYASDWEMEANNWHENASKGVDEFVKSILSSASDRVDFWKYVWGDFFRYEPIKFTEGMKSIGIDGIIVPGYAGTDGMAHLIAYNPDALEIENIIKS